jgi:hypothetical protein
VPVFHRIKKQINSASNSLCLFVFDFIPINVFDDTGSLGHRNTGLRLNILDKLTIVPIGDLIFYVLIGIDQQIPGTNEMDAGETCIVGKVFKYADYFQWLGIVQFQNPSHRICLAEKSFCAGFAEQYGIGICKILIGTGNKLQRKDLGEIFFNIDPLSGEFVVVIVQDVFAWFGCYGNLLKQIPVIFLKLAGQRYGKMIVVIGNIGIAVRYFFSGDLCNFLEVFIVSIKGKFIPNP